MTTCEVWVMVDEDGNYSVGEDRDRVQERYDEQHASGGAKRLVSVVLTVPEPKPVEVTVEVPEEEVGEVEVSVA